MTDILNIDHESNIDADIAGWGAPSAPASEAPTAKDIAVQLRKDMSAVRLHRGKWGISKKLTRGQIDQAAKVFDANGKRLSASKKIINSRAEKYRAPNSTISEAVAYWRSITIPYPEDGVRLIKRKDIETFVNTMAGFKQTLAGEASELEAVYQTLVEESRAELGTTFNEQDYPASVAHLFTLEWDFPSVEPPAHLMEIAPKVYAQEMARIQARFEQAVSLTEEAFTQQFNELVEHLVDRLEYGDVDPETGERKPKVFKDTAITKFVDFVEAFRHLNVGSNPELAQLIDTAAGLVTNVSAKDLRKDVTKRGALQRDMAEIKGKLDQMLEAKPLRKINLFDKD